eukprot:3393351-Prymnesium_polylepis.3
MPSRPELSLCVAAHHLIKLGTYLLLELHQHQRLRAVEHFVDQPLHRVHINPSRLVLQLVLKGLSKPLPWLYNSPVPRSAPSQLDAAPRMELRAEVVRCRRWERSKLPAEALRGAQPMQSESKRCPSLPVLIVRHFWQRQRRTRMLCFLRCWCSRPQESLLGDVEDLKPRLVAVDACEEALARGIGKAYLPGGEVAQLACSRLHCVATPQKVYLTAGATSCPLLRACARWERCPMLHPPAAAPSCPGKGPLLRPGAIPRPFPRSLLAVAVSYTHLTLPTICSV